MKFSKRIGRLGTETAFDVLRKVNQARAEGRDIISFAIGEPDFNTPENIKEAAKTALDENQTHYNPSNGLVQLREAVCQEAAVLRPGYECRADEVVVTPGAKPVIFHSILSIAEPGDEVVYPNPGFPIYESMIRFVGATPVACPIRESKNFSIDIDDLKQRITDRTALIIINSPHNPTGGMLSKNDLETIAQSAKKHDAWVLSDEVYNRMVWQGEFFSISQLPGMKERTIIVDGCSKTYAMTGWRIGWGIMPEELAGKVSRLITNSDSCTCTFTQLAALQALRSPKDDVERMMKEFRERSKIVTEGLNQIEGVSCVEPKGAFYAFANVTQACRRLGLTGSKELADYLLEKAGVAVLSRSCFGSRNQGEEQEYIRISYATSKELIKQGLARMRQAIENTP